MLTVAFDTNPLQNDSAIRGIGMYTKLLMAELAKRSDVKVLTSGQQIAQPESPESQVLEKPDITHYPFFDLFFATLPLKRKTKTVVTIHDVIPLIFPEEYKPGVKGKLRFYRQLLALKTVDAVLTDSYASQKDIIKYLKVAEKKVHVTHLAGNPEIQKATASEVAEIRQKYKLPKKYILYVGDINYNKNLPQLIKSLKFLPEEISLVCVGKNFFPHQIPEWSWIERQAALSDVGSRLQFVPNISGDASKDLSAIFTGAECYVQPSLYEGFGLPVLEAMNCRTPVVSTQNSSLIEVGGEYSEFVKEDAESIAQGVKKILEWSEHKKEVHTRAAFQWSQRFTWQKTAAETMKVYKSIV